MSRDIDPEDVLYSQNDKDPLSFCEKVSIYFFKPVNALYFDVGCDDDYHW